MIFQGIAASPGIGIGKVFFYEHFSFQFDIYENGTREAELEKYVLACKKAYKEIENLILHFDTNKEKEKADIFRSHLQFLSDEVMDEEIRDHIDRGEGAPRGIAFVYQQYEELFKSMDNPVIQERVADLKDVSLRLLRCLAGVEEKNLSVLPGKVIVVTHDLTPSDTAMIDRKNIVGMVTEIGGNTSHSAIIARGYDIPALLGVKNIVAKLHEGQTIIVDAEEGVLLDEYDAELLTFYQKKQKNYYEQTQLTKEFLTKKAVTQDGVSISLELNLSSATLQDLTQAAYTDGVGLFRTEFLYMNRRTLPTEEEQFRVYRNILLAFKNKPVILRTLDIGGDKNTECIPLPKEENPFLGNRALRLCLENPLIFRTQIRAALLASMYGNLWMMFPMVSSLDDFRRAKSEVEKVKADLRTEGLSYKDIKLGIMIETPAIAILAGEISKEADFASIGTNDLTQYLLAVDRGNPEVSSYYQMFHPAVFRLISYVADQFQKAGKAISICGELGGNPLAVCAMIGMGIRQFSMSASSIASVKQAICSSKECDLKDMAEKVLQISNEADIVRFLQNAL